jgi:hypothetical protein
VKSKVVRAACSTYEKTTDVTHLAQFLIYVSCVYSDDTETVFLFCKLLETATAMGVPYVVSDFLKNAVSGGKT